MIRRTNLRNAEVSFNLLMRIAKFTLTEISEADSRPGDHLHEGEENNLPVEQILQTVGLLSVSLHWLL